MDRSKTSGGWNADRHRYDIRVGRSQSPKGPFVDLNGTALVDGGGYIVYGSHDYVYAPGGEGVINYNGRDVLYYHYGVFVGLDLPE